jgi:diguanylate cyclase
MNDESQKYIAVIFKEWLPLYDSLTPEVSALLKKLPMSIVDVSDPFLRFYFQDPDIAGTSL